MKTLRITLEGKTYEVGVEVLGGAPASYSPPPSAPIPVAPSIAPAAASAATTGSAASAVHSPMPGVVFKLRVALGQKVAKDEELIVLEAMKMESPLYAPCAGTVASITVKEGDSVHEGQLLIQMS